MLLAWFRRYRFPLGAWSGLAATLVVLQFWSSKLSRGGRLLPYQGIRYYLDGWDQFDGPRYEEIARVGYSYVPGRASNIVWFPGYPLAMRLVHLVVDDLAAAGVVASMVGGVLAVVAYWAWLTDRSMAGTARASAFLLLLLYPYGYYLFGVVYADSLCVGLTIAAFVLVARGRLVWGGLVGALATLTRPTGPALVVGLVLLGLQGDGVLTVPADARGWVARLALPIQIQRDRLRAASFAPLLAVGGLVSYATYLWVRWGSPLLFVTNERYYHPEDRPILKKAFVYKVLHFGDDPTYAVTIIGQALVVAMVIACVPAVCRRFGFAYGAYVAVLVAIPTLTTGDFMGTGRYLMAAFPVFALLGERLGEGSPTLRRAVLGTSGALMVFASWAFSRSWYLT